MTLIITLAAMMTVLWGVVYGIEEAYGADYRKRALRADRATPVKPKLDSGPYKTLRCDTPSVARMSALTDGISIRRWVHDTRPRRWR